MRALACLAAVLATSCTLVSGLDDFSFGGHGPGGAGGMAGDGGAAGLGGGGAGGAVGGAAGGGSGGACAADTGDCDGDTGNGCETDLLSDALHCGACGRPCAPDGVHTARCEGGACVPVCEVGLLDVNHPSPPAVDDGCEQSSDASSCGSPGVVCDPTAVCEVGATSALCGPPNGDGSCGSISLATCSGGESCEVSAGIGSCRCNGAAACGANLQCCPTGCVNTSVTATDCGACGRACAAGMVCASGDCRCDSADDCDGGRAGACAGGKCVCEGVTCATGERCRSDGSCG